jgi:hypothetical protein
LLFDQPHPSALCLVVTAVHAADLSMVRLEAS